MESANIGTYRDVELFLIKEGAQYFIAFGSPDNHHYWLVALNKILTERPDYKFKALTSNSDEGIEVDMQEFKSAIEYINNVVELMSTSRK